MKGGLLTAVGFCEGCGPLVFGSEHSDHSVQCNVLSHAIFSLSSGVKHSFSDCIGSGSDECTNSQASCRMLFIRIARSITESKEDSSSHTILVQTSLLSPCWNTALRADSFQPLSAARVQNLRSIVAAWWLPCQMARIHLLTSFPSGA